MSVDVAGLAASAWSLTVQGSCHDPDALRSVADIEAALVTQLGSVLTEPLYGVVSSSFAGQTRAATPGVPELIPDPPLAGLSPEAQITALQEQVAQLQAALAISEGNGP